MTTCELPVSVDIEALRTLRKGKKLTQAEVAERASLSVKGYQMVENGETPNPGIVTLGLICDAIGIRIFQIVVEDRPDMPNPPDLPGSE
jgi:transcriptional regulator with XRE-family HTH domain